MSDGIQDGHLVSDLTLQRNTSNIHCCPCKNIQTDQLIKYEDFFLISLSGKVVKNQISQLSIEEKRT